MLKTCIPGSYFLVLFRAMMLWIFKFHASSVSTCDIILISDVSMTSEILQIFYFKASLDMHAESYQLNKSMITRIGKGIKEGLSVNGWKGNTKML